MAYLDPDYIVVVRVEIRPASENTASDFVLPDYRVRVAQNTLTQIKEDLAQLYRFEKLPAGGNAQSERPTLIVNPHVADLNLLGVNVASMTAIHTLNLPEIISKLYVFSASAVPPSPKVR
jgi:hypothetical protein